MERNDNYQSNQYYSDWSITGDNKEQSKQTRKENKEEEKDRSAKIKDQTKEAAEEIKQRTGTKKRERNY